MKNKRKASSSSGGAVSSPQRPPTANVSDAPISGPQFLPGMSVPSSMSATGTVTTAPPNPTLPAPGTEDVLEALEHNINFLADTMANQGQNTDADLARLHALRSTLQQTKDLHAQNERQRIDTFLTMSAVQANGAIPQLTAQQQAMASLNGVNLPQSQLDNSLPNASADVSSNNVGGGDGTAALTDTDGTAIADTDNSANAKNADTDITGTNDSIVADAGATKNNTKKAYTQPKLDPELEKMLQPTGFLDCPAMSPEEEERELKSLSEADYYKAYADIYGRKPTPLAQVEQMLIDVDMELSRLPREDAAAINAARDALPLLCLSSRHIMLFLQNEDFVPRRAALRMARFWTERIDLYGDAAFNITSNISLPTEDDLLRMYNRSYDVVECRDPAVREENRAMARAFLDRFEGCMIEAIRNEIHTYPDSKKESYLKALKSCPHRVEELYLDFLRCTNFSIKSSAERMINYFHFYDKLFGPSASDNLVGEFLPISQMTMGDRAIEDLELGFCRLVPNANDAHGRPIMFFDFSYLEEGSYTMMGAVSIFGLKWWLCFTTLATLLLLTYVTRRRFLHNSSSRYSMLPTSWRKMKTH